MTPFCFFCSFPFGKPLHYDSDFLTVFSGWFSKFISERVFPEFKSADFLFPNKIVLNKSNPIIVFCRFALLMPDFFYQALFIWSSRPLRISWLIRPWEKEIMPRRGR